MKPTNKIQYIPIGDLRLLPGNPRLIKNEQFKKLCDSIQTLPRYFESRPCLVNDESGNLVIYAGNMRYKAAREIGLKEVPCIVETLTEEEQRERTIRDNVELGEWDMDMLANEWDEKELAEWGLNVANIFDGGGGLTDEDAVPESPPEPIAKPGDLYALGDHRLLCGDSTNAQHLERLMNGEKAEMVFTDPPYNIETEGGCKGNIGKSLKKQGKDIDFISDFDPQDFLNILPLVFPERVHNSYIFCNKQLIPAYLNWAVKNKISYNVLVWKKPSAIPIGGSHRPDIEYLILFRKSAIWNGALKNVNYSRCLEYGRVTGEHPTVKPVELIENEVYISSNENGVIIDFFGGSGSTLIACEKTKRKCFIMEDDPAYCDVIIKRWEDYTGKKTEVIND